MKSKQVLDVQQMQRLQELGLELKETMLYRVVYEAGHENNFVTTKENAMEVIDESCGMLPAYTLQDVLDALPEEINPGTRRFWLRIDFFDECLYYYYDDDKLVEHRKKVIDYDGMDGLIDAAYSMLCWVIENKFVDTNKEKCCGSCRWFCNEDIYGGGWCAIKRGERTCAEICGKWEGIP